MTFKPNAQSKKELCAIIVKNWVKNKERRKTEKGLQYFQKLQFFYDNMSISSKAEGVDIREILYSSSE